MTLDEAIRHTEEVATQCSFDNPLCAEDHLQLSRWLRELKKYKEKYGEEPIL